MTLIRENVSLQEFEPWSGARYTWKNILEAGKESDFEALIDDLYPDGLTDTQLNDILWFEPEWIYESLGMTEYIENND